MSYDRLGPKDENREDTLQHLHHDLRDHRFGGLVLLGHRPAFLKNDDVRTDLPSVVFFPATSSIHKPEVELDYYDFTHTACSYLAKRGRKRITYLGPFWDAEFAYARDVDGFSDASSAYQLKVGPGSIRPFPQEPVVERDAVEHSGYEQTQRWIQGWKRRSHPPDGLIVSDDIRMRGWPELWLSGKSGFPKS